MTYEILRRAYACKLCRASCCDIVLRYEKADKKAKDKIYIQDIAFQYLVLKELEVPIGKLNLIRFNSEYIRGIQLDIKELFSIEDFTERVMENIEIVSGDMKNSYDLLSLETKPFGSCKCITRGRSSHCTTFSTSNPHVPEYSVHDISRIGSSKAKLAELIDSNIFHIPQNWSISCIFQ